MDIVVARCTTGADDRLPLNARQLNNIAGGGQTGEKKEGESLNASPSFGRVR